MGAVGGMITVLKIEKLYFLFVSSLFRLYFKLILLLWNIFFWCFQSSAVQAFGVSQLILLAQSRLEQAHAAHASVSETQVWDCNVVDE